MPKFILYKIYYDDNLDKDVLIYLGRTKQPLQNRIRGHLFKKPMHRSIDIHQVSKIEYAEFQTEADMNIYEIYLINTLKPPFNVDDKTPDYPTISLPDVSWLEFKTKLWDKWIGEIEAMDEGYNKSRKRYAQITEDIRINRGLFRTGEITEDQYWESHEKLVKEQSELHNKLYKN